MMQSKEWDQVIFQLFIDSLNIELFMLRDKPNRSEGYVVALQEKKKLIEARMKQYEPK